MNKYVESRGELWQTVHYRNMVEAVESLKPIIPSFQYKGESNIEEIKYKLAQVQMYEAIIAILKPKEI